MLGRQPPAGAKSNNCSGLSAGTSGGAGVPGGAGGAGGTGRRRRTIVRHEPESRRPARCLPFRTRTNIRLEPESESRSSPEPRSRTILRV